MSKEAVLEAEAIGHAFQGRAVLVDISLSLPAGSLCAVLGPNGRGKSTLLKILAGTLPPQRGRVRRRGRIGFVPQEVQPALDLSVREMVLLGRAGRIALFSAPGPTDHAAADHALGRVGARHLDGRRFDSLSGGERQLVMMARALAGGAEILLLDEPTAALDWQRQALILGLLVELVGQGLTVVMSTHAPQHALDFASHVLLLPRGRPHRFGAPAATMDDTSLGALYGLPVVQVPVDALPSGRAIVPLLHPGTDRPLPMPPSPSSPRHEHPAPASDLP